LTKDRTHLPVKEGTVGFYAQNLTEERVSTSAEMMKILKKGQKSRSVGATAMNAGSSRSHSVFTVIIESCTLDENDEENIKVGKLNMVDLAGSERQKKTKSTGDRLDEAKAINLSLSALGNCIKALVNPNATYVPYRDSKLTRLLKDSLGGNTKTTMIANIGPSKTNLDETMSTLRYANRAKDIKNKPKINEDPKDSMIKTAQKEIERLRIQLEASGGRRKIEKRIIEKTVWEGEDKDKVMEELARDEAATKQLHEEEMKLAEERHKNARAKYTEDATKALTQVDKINQELEAAEEEKEKLIESYQRAKAELIRGGKVLIDAKKRKKQLRQLDQQLMNEEREQAMLEQEIIEEKERAEILSMQVPVLMDNIQLITKELKELKKKHAMEKEDLKDLQEEYIQERTILTDRIRDLNKDVQLKSLLMENFIPPLWIRFLEEHALWDPNQEIWRFPMEEILKENLELISSRPRTAGRRPVVQNKLLHLSKNHGLNQKRPDLMASADLMARNRSCLNPQSPAGSQQEIQQILLTALETTQDPHADMETAFFEYDRD